ncbi:hypothetical protein ABZ863_14795 [Saccharomonospora sp. NPDC046836]|uniref:hypothetical protein n=1 Tax=Saccharomonospora sp. NPDC046836 TaxID=3156921 RepID=UPI00340B3052
MRVFAVLVGVLAVLVGALAVGGPAAAVAAEPVAAVAPALTQETAEPGPTLDPQTEADARKTRSRLVVGVAAAALLGIVVWGRHVRSKRKKTKKK